MSHVIQFTYLQVLDLLTTIAFLLHGVREANPLVNSAILFSPHPVMGLLFIKVAAVLLGVYCWRRGKGRMLLQANALFALLIAWNLLALIARSASMA